MGGGKKGKRQPEGDKAPKPQASAEADQQASSRPPALALGVVVVVLALILGLGALSTRGPADEAQASPSPASLSRHPSGARWVAGDVHLHSENSAGVSLTPEAVLELMEEQDLEVGVVHIWGVRPDKTARNFRGVADVASGARILHYDLEVSSFNGLHQHGHKTFGGFPDHVIGLRLRDWLFPRRLFTHPIVDWITDQGAVAGVAHAGLWGDDPSAFPERITHAPAELPACLILGQPLFLSTEHVNNEGFYRLYYGLLNCGFEVPLTAGSDYPVTSGPPGSPRTRVLIEGELSYEAWVEGIRRGRTTIAANAHDQLNLTARGEQVGARLALRQGEGLEVRTDYFLKEPATLELLVNGVPIFKEAVEGSGTWTRKLTLLDSSWIAVRCTSAHTGPIYVELDGRGIRASENNALYFRQYMDSLLAQIALPTFVYGQPNKSESVLVEEERRLAIETYERARKAWDQRILECRERQALLQTRRLGG